jgi:hypothetical protein
MFTHIPLQQVKFGDCEQGLSQPPQFAESVCRFLHTPLQQVSPVAHAPPQPVQFASSIGVHTPSQQRLFSVLQQTPPQHDSPVGHVTASGQFEQFASLISVQTPSQVIVPSAQHSTPYCPNP